MEDQLFNDAVFRLGQLGADRALTNHKLLRRVSRILARYTGVEVAGVAVHNDGMKHPASQTYVVGPWSDEQSSQFLLVVLGGLRLGHRDETLEFQAQHHPHAR